MNRFPRAGAPPLGAPSAGEAHDRGEQLGMRRSIGVCAVLVELVAVLTFPAYADVAPGGIMSSNVDWLGNIPLDSPGVSARVVRVGDVPRLYVSGVKNLTIYDLSNPALPLPMGALALPNWQNEDIDVSEDGSTVLVANDAGVWSYLIDASDPRAPVLQGRIPGSEHTLSCADPRCMWAYGSYGDTYDLRDRAAPRRLPVGWQEQLGIGSAHDLYRDDSGLMSVDSTPRMLIDPREDPANPSVVAVGPVPDGRRLAYQHNSIRPGASEWTPRGPSDTGDGLRPGELLIAGGENIDPTCGPSAGPVMTWSIRDFEKGAPMKVLDVFRPVAGDWTNGDAAVDPLGCSTHWFTERDGLVAAGWYEHGTRFLRVDSATGAISQVGYFQPAVGSASAAYWITDEIVYVVDYERGIDILRFDRSAPVPSGTTFADSWTRRTGPTSSFATSERLACRLAMGGERT